MADLWHSWGTSPKQKAREKEYNHWYYEHHKEDILRKQQQRKFKDTTEKGRDANPNNNMDGVWSNVHKWKEGYGRLPAATTGSYDLKAEIEKLNRMQREREVQKMQDYGYSNRKIRELGYEDVLPKPTRHEYAQAGVKYLRENAKEAVLGFSVMGVPGLIAAGTTVWNDMLRKWKNM